MLPEESSLAKNEGQEGYACYFLCFTYSLPVECSPRSLGASSTVHDRFQEWRSAGVFKHMWIDGLSVYDKKIEIDWKWQAMDGVSLRLAIVS